MPLLHLFGNAKVGPIRFIFFSGADVHTSTRPLPLYPRLHALERNFPFKIWPYSFPTFSSTLDPRVFQSLSVHLPFVLCFFFYALLAQLPPKDFQDPICSIIPYVSTTTPFHELTCQKPAPCRAPTYFFLCVLPCTRVISPRCVSFYGNNMGMFFPQHFPRLRAVPPPGLILREPGRGFLTTCFLNNGPLRIQQGQFLPASAKIFAVFFAPSLSWIASFVFKTLSSTPRVRQNPQLPCPFHVTFT